MKSSFTMKRIFVLCAAFLLIVLLSACGGIVEPTEIVKTTDAPTEVPTGLPPFFNKTYDLEGGCLVLTAVDNNGDVMVSIDYQIDENEIELSALLYMEIYLKTGLFAQNVGSLAFTVHDSKYENSGYAMYLNGKTYMYEDPPFYGKEYDYSEDGPFSKEKHLRVSGVVDEAFTELEEAL